MRSENGFAVVEALGVSGFAIAFASVGISTAYVSFARTWLDRNSYEAAVCLASDANRYTCEQRLREAISNGLPLGRTESLRLARSSSAVEIHGVWRLGVAVRLKIHDRRALPLRSAK